MRNPHGKKSLWDFFSFLGATLSDAIQIRGNRHISPMVLMRQILFTGYEALPLISFIALGIGGLVILQGYTLLSNFGQGNLVHMILVTVVINELSAMITALVVIARSGTAISTELGNMVVHREIDLLRSFGMSPISYLIVSRVYGVMAAMLILTAYFNIIAVLGGWLFSQLFSAIEFRAFFNDFFNQVRLSSIVVTIVKPLVFGLVIAVVSSYEGMSVKRSSTEVPQRTIKAVVNSIVLIVIADFIITWLTWVLVPR
ncbi:MAG TPA: ABC transporter permease [Candidatus Cloacimonadota bacterium]|nr:ABC transporter permease [Candidatus Cloacimonadota bacterium]